MTRQCIFMDQNEESTSLEVKEMVTDMYSYVIYRISLSVYRNVSGVSWPLHYEFTLFTECEDKCRLED